MSALEVHDNGGGSVTLVWPAYAIPAATSWDVYLNNVLQGNTAARTWTFTGLQFASYNSASGVRTAALTYYAKVVPVSAGSEKAYAIDATFTPGPTSVQLATRMRRPFPFPNTGAPDGAV
jgi:hypothetical protein